MQIGKKEPSGATEDSRITARGESKRVMTLTALVWPLWTEAIKRTHGSQSIGARPESRLASQIGFRIGVLRSRAAEANADP
jgi:hypothetical protein